MKVLTERVNKHPTYVAQQEAIKQQ